MHANANGKRPFLRTSSDAAISMCRERVSGARPAARFVYKSLFLFEI